MFAQRSRPNWTQGAYDANMQERREYEVPFRERERDEGYRGQQRGADPWGRPTRATPRRQIREPPPQRREPILERREPMMERRDPMPQTRDPLPQHLEPLPQRVEPPPQHREPPRERYFCPNCTCPRCRPDDLTYRAAGGNGGGSFHNPTVIDERVRQRYDALPPANDGYFPRERRPLQGEEPLPRERPWPVQETRSGPQGPPPEAMRSGDWSCPSCNAHNYSDKIACYVCSVPKPEGGLGGHRGGFNGVQQVGFNGGQQAGFQRPREERRAGDWDCPQCNAHNFAFKTACFKCNIPKPESRPGANPMQGRGGEGGRRAVTRRPGDWNCRECNAHNFSRNTSCFKCKVPKE